MKKNRGQCSATGFEKAGQCSATGFEKALISYPSLTHPVSFYSLDRWSISMYHVK